MICTRYRSSAKQARVVHQKYVYRRFSMKMVLNCVHIFGLLTYSWSRTLCQEECLSERSNEKLSLFPVLLSEQFTTANHAWPIRVLFFHVRGLTLRYETSGRATPLWGQCISWHLKIKGQREIMDSLLGSGRTKCESGKIWGPTTACLLKERKEYPFHVLPIHPEGVFTWVWTSTFWRQR